MSSSFQSMGLLSRRLPSDRSYQGALPEWGCSPSRRSLPLLEDLVDQAVVDGLLRAHEPVAVRVGDDSLERLARVLGQDVLEAPLQVEDLAGADLDVGRLA